MPRSDRIENQFHDLIWGAANNWQQCEAAIADARTALLIAVKDDAEPRIVQQAAANWLRRFG